MIKFNEKIFFVGQALNVLGAVGTPLMGVQMIQENNNNEEREEEAERQEKLLEDQNNLIRKQNASIAKLGKGQQAAVQGIKSFAATGGLWKAVKDVGSAAKTAFSKDALNNAKMAATLAGAGYLANKWIQHDMKKSGMDVDQETGQLTQKSYGLSGALLNVGINGAMVAPEVAGYYADKKQFKDQQKATQQQAPQQTQHSTPTLKGITEKQFSILGTWKGWTGLTKEAARQNKIQAGSGILANIMSMGLAGPNNIAKFGSELSKKGGNLAKAGEWIQKNPTMANLGVGALGVGGTKLTWDAVESGSNKVLEKVDPGAYKYKNAKNQQLEQ